MRTLVPILVLASTFFASSPAFAERDCSIELIIDSQRTLTKYRSLEEKVLRAFPETGYNPMLAFEMLLTNQTLALANADDWVFLRDMRSQLNVSGNSFNSTQKRAMASLFDLGLFEAKDNMERRTEKLIRLTEKGQQLINQVLGE